MTAKELVSMEMKAFMTKHIDEVVKTWKDAVDIQAAMTKHIGKCKAIVEEEMGKLGCPYEITTAHFKVEKRKVSVERYFFAMLRRFFTTSRVSTCEVLSFKALPCKLSKAAKAKAKAKAKGSMMEKAKPAKNILKS